VAPTPPPGGRLAYLVFDDLALSRYGNTLIGAQVRVEVMTLGATYHWPYTAFSASSNKSWKEPVYDGTVFCSVAGSHHAVMVSGDGLAWTEYAIPNGASANYQGTATDGAGTLLAFGVGAVWRSTDHGQTWTTPATYYAGYTTQIEWNGNYFLAITDTGNFFTSTNGIAWTSRTPPAGYGSYAQSLTWNGALWAVRPAFGTGREIWTSPTGYTGSWTLALTMPSGFNNFNRCTTKDGQFLYSGVGTVGGVYGPACYLSDDGITWTAYQAPASFNSVATDGRVYLGTSNAAYYVSTDGITWATYALPVSGVTWVAGAGPAGFAAVRNGSTGVLIYPLFVSSIYPTLAQVVSTECLQSGLLTAGDIDVVALGSTTVRGYRVGSVGAIRAALEPLQGAWPFDVRQQGYDIQFIPRGGASVVTIPAANLDARAAGEAPGVQITTRREMDSQLPRRVTVQYLDFDREYNVGTQYAERLNTPAIHATLLDLPIVLTATEAAGKAEVLLYLYWLERHDVSFVLPPTYHHLEPGDVVTVVAPEGSMSLRLVAIDYSSDGRVECKAKYASAAIYTPTAVGVASAVTGPTTITQVGAAVYHLLDVPLLSSVQAGPSFLAAMTGALAGWEGGVLMQSTDAGGSWASLADFSAPGAEMGSCSNAIGITDPRTIDAGSVLTVTLTQGELSSITLLALLAGGNHFAYGADGRWEIIAAQTCTLVSGTTYALTNLLRGRYGTEWAMGLHLAGDALILLDSLDTLAITMSTGSIGLSSLYRGITVDRDISTDSNRVFAYLGVNLRPLSPIALTGNRDPSSNDWTLTWIRRTRTGGEWRDYVDADLGETSEAYQIDIYADGTYTTVKRTISTSMPAASYSSADQVSDFGANQATLYLKLTQISATVGRGYPLITSLTR
jgi:hypothetical protein